MRILSTEDDPLVRTMLAELLSSDGHDVEFARNSDDFFRLVGANTYDLLILDVNIPGLNGYQIAREIVSRLGEKRPKMLLFTGRDTQAEKGLIELSGVDAVLEKGGPTAKILEAVNKLMAPPGPAAPDRAIGRGSAASEVRREAAVGDPRDVEKLYQKGVEYYARGEFLQATSMFLRILQIDPENDQARKALERIDRRKTKR